MFKLRKDGEVPENETKAYKNPYQIYCVLFSSMFIQYIVGASYMLAEWQELED